MNVPAIGLSNILLRLSGYRRLLLALPIVIGVAVGVYFKLQPPVFSAYARLLPPQTNSSSATAMLNQVGGNAVLGAAALSLKNPSDMYASLLLSRTVQDDVIAKFQLQKQHGIDDVDQMRVEVSKRTRVDVGKDGIITLSYTDRSADMAADVANGLIDAMYRVSRHLAREDTQRRMSFYDALIDEAREKQHDADMRLLELELKTGLTRLKGQEESSTGAMAELRGLIATREVELSKALLTATERHPEVMRMRSELASLRGHLGRLESRIFGRTGASDSELKQYEEARKDKNLFLPFNEYAQRRAIIEPARRNVENAENIIANLVKAREFARGDETRDLSVLQILDRAVPPTRKSGPRVVVNAIVGAVIGLLLAIMIALFWDILFTDESRRNRWKSVGSAFIQKPGTATAANPDTQP